MVTLLFAATHQGLSLQDSEQKTAFASSAVSQATCAPAAPPSEPADSPFVSFPDRPESALQEPPTRHWEYAEPEILTPFPPGVKGRLKQCLSFWEEDLKASQFIIDVVKNGYKIPFETIPPPFCAKNNRSSLNHPEFVESAISDLLRKHCIVEVDSRPLCCNPLTVSEGKKLRLVLDLRHPNNFVKKFKFRYEDLPHITQALDKDQFYFSFDFESGYHHIDIFPLHQQYLGFSWTHKDSTLRYYKFTVLPFGLNSASYLFTKLTRPLVYHWRSRGILSFIYIDDGLIISPTLSLANLNLTIVRDTIVHSGFVFSKKKCVWQPTQSICYLGFTIDSKTERFYIPKAKIDKLLSLIDLISTLHESKRKVPVKTLASCAGQLISMSLALGPVSSLMTRALYRAIESRSFWSDSIFLSESVTDELSFWSTNISLFNGSPFRFRLAPTIQVFSDASDFGFGGYIPGYANLCFHGAWNESEAKNSSTWRELATVHRILLQGTTLFSRQKIKWFTDNSNVPRIIRKGSTKPDLHSLAISIFNLCRLHDIIIIPEWLPRIENKLADRISRYRDFDDWSIDQVSFLFIDSIWGPHSIDRFASPQNNKIPVFNSRFWCKDSAGIDAFCQDWSADNNYFCPPVSLIPQVIKRMASFKAVGTLLVPKWPASSFWPFICPDGSHFNVHVHDWRLMNVSFTPSSLGVSNVFCEKPSFFSLALRFNFRIPPRRVNRGFCSSELGYCAACT